MRRVKWWGSTRLNKQVGKGVFLTDQKPATGLQELYLSMHLSTSNKFIPLSFFESKPMPIFCEFIFIICESEVLPEEKEY